MSFTALHDRVLVRRIEGDECLTSGPMGPNRLI
jgi:co-chaperonin GroES (HSP10)